MSTRAPDPYESLQRLFHEPNRLRIMSAICASEKGMSFNELKAECGLTDGNLNRHLSVLEEADAVRIKKTFVGVKPRTTVYLTTTGLERFNEYIEALHAVLEQARAALPEEAKREKVPFDAAMVRVRT